MNKVNMPKLLGILGGLGPMSGVYFCSTLISHTKAHRDCEHINFLLSSRADTPDRSSFILGNSDDNPAPIMIEEAKRLEAAGANIIAIPCNTAHYFYDKICNSVNIPIINIIEETAKFCAHQGFSRVAVLATEGTVASGAYSDVFSSYGIEIIPLTADEQCLVTTIIFDQIKRCLPPDIEGFRALSRALEQRGCEQIILGCTELSLIKSAYPLSDKFTDSLEVLALSAINRCGKEPVRFDPPLMKYHEDTKKGR